MARRRSMQRFEALAAGGGTVFVPKFGSRCPIHWFLTGGEAVRKLIR